MTEVDVLVVGRGPAALAAAAELSERGLRTGVLGPAGPLHWPARYGAWADDLAAAGHADAIGHSCPAAVMNAGGGRHHVLPRAYVLIDNARLLGTLAGRCDAAGVAWVNGAAASVAHEARRSLVTCGDGSQVAARVVVDASGHRPALVERDPEPPQAFQTAFGLSLRVEGTPLDPGQAVLMDWSDDHLPGKERGGTPTFLYAFPLDPGRVFVEETALAARPALAYQTLEMRLRTRLRAMGIDAERVEGTERVLIPMGGALPDPRQRVVGFGAAAGMVHPATGYSVVRSLAAAPALAETLARELGRGERPAHAAREAWRTLWPADAVRRHALYRFGMETLLTLDGDETREFFDRFFRLPQEDWGGYLADRVTSAELARIMTSFFATAPGELRSRMTASAMGPMGRELAGSMFGSITRLLW